MPECTEHKALRFAIAPAGDLTTLIKYPWILGILLRYPSTGAR